MTNDDIQRCLRAHRCGELPIVDACRLLDAIAQDCTVTLNTEPAKLPFSLEDVRGETDTRVTGFVTADFRGVYIQFDQFGTLVDNRPIWVEQRRGIPHVVVIPDPRDKAECHSLEDALRPLAPGTRVQWVTPNTTEAKAHVVGASGTVHADNGVEVTVAADRNRGYRVCSRNNVSVLEETSCLEYAEEAGIVDIVQQGFVTDPFGTVPGAILYHRNFPFKDGRYMAIAVVCGGNGILPRCTASLRAPDGSPIGDEVSGNSLIGRHRIMNYEVNIHRGS